MFNTTRGLLKYILLDIITFGIYGIVVMTHISEEINVIAMPRDGKHTMHYLLVYLVFGVLTLYIAPLVWSHRLCNRIGDELVARNCGYTFGASDFWLWNVLGCLIIIGPFVWRHKILKAMNLINLDYITNRNNAA